MTTDENGRKTATATGFRHRSSCTVKVTDQGSGKIIVDGLTMDMFYFAQSRYESFLVILADDYAKKKRFREQLLFPFIVLNRLGQFDVESTSLSLTGRSQRDAHSPKAVGESVVTGATRHGISLALLAFITPEEAEKLRLGKGNGCMSGWLVHGYFLHFSWLID